MKPHQLIGYVLNQTTAITSLVSTRSYFGMRLQTTATLPAINYFELPGRRANGIGSKTFSINCRATDPAVARNIAEKVIDTFAGSSGTGIYGSMSSGSVFDFKSALVNDNGLIPEPDGNVYNAPVDILITYPVDTVS